MFDRLIKLIGTENFEKINNKKILLVGVGGVGGFVLEALVRSGINDLTIYDADKIEITNLNRQIIATTKNVGKYKVDEAIKRMLEINNAISIKGIKEKIDAKTIQNLVKYDYIIDACDDINAKVLLIKYAITNNIKIISALGTGKRFSTENIIFTTLNKTKNDPLARVLRTKLKKEKISLKIPVVYSEELPSNSEKEISSCIFTPAIAGIKIAYYVLDDIIKNSPCQM